MILITYFYEKSGLFKIILVKRCSVKNIFIDLNFSNLPCFWNCTAWVRYIFNEIQNKYHPTSAPYSIFIFHSFIINFLCSTTVPTGPGVSHYQGFMITLRHTHLAHLIWKSDQPDAEASTSQTHITHETDIHDAHGILIHNPIKRVVIDPCFKMHGHCIRPSTIKNPY